MDINDFLKNPGNQKHEVDLPLALVRIIELGCYNRIYLQSILKIQLDTQELIKGNTDVNERVSKRIEEIETNISQIANEVYHQIINEVLK